MKKIIASLVAAAAVALPVHSDPLQENEYNTHHSMGCMLLGECTDGVKQVTNLLDISSYHTVGNNFFLNREYMSRPNILMQVMRHEGWHAAQDCMAGTIDNSLIAIIKPEEDVPMIWRVMAERTYPEHAVPWEAEAGWAGRTEGMTKDALSACAKGKMWEVYEPTPLTRKYLVDMGYIAK